VAYKTICFFSDSDSGFQLSSSLSVDETKDERALRASFAFSASDCEAEEVGAEEDDDEGGEEAVKEDDCGIEKDEEGAYEYRSLEIDEHKFCTVDKSSTHRTASSTVSACNHHGLSAVRSTMTFQLSALAPDLLIALPLKASSAVQGLPVSIKIASTSLS
jgi:hypothetical protein